MNKKRREDIDANVKLLLKKYSSEEVGFLGAILGNVIQEKKAITKKERNFLISMLNDRSFPPICNLHPYLLYKYKKSYDCISI